MQGVLKQLDNQYLPQSTYDDFVNKFQRLAILDYIIRNTDRNNTNWLIKCEQCSLEVISFLLLGFFMRSNSFSLPPLHRWLVHVYYEYELIPYMKWDLLFTFLMICIYNIWSDGCQIILSLRGFTSKNSGFKDFSMDVLLSRWFWFALK